MNFKGIKELLVIGEKKTFSDISDIVEFAKQANNVAIKMFSSNGQRDHAAEKEEIKKIERNSDEASFKVSINITNGAVSSNILDNLLRCVSLADDMVDNYYYLSREIDRIKGVKILEEQENDSHETILKFYSSFVSMLKLAGEAMELLQKLLHSPNLKDVLDLRKEIQKLEEEGDNVKDSSFDRLYEDVPLLHYLQFNHLSEMLHKLDDILDSCEDLSDLVVSIITSISK